MTKPSIKAGGAEKRVRKSVEYLIRARDYDGNWHIDRDEVFTKREAEKLRQFNRIMGGILSQLWRKDEWVKLHPRPTVEEPGYVHEPK